MRALMMTALAAALSLAAAPAPGTPVAETDGWNSILDLSADAIAQYTGLGYQHIVATDTGGNVHVVWYNVSGTYNQVFYRRWTRATGTWGTVTQLTNQAVSVYRPAVACDYSGNVHVVWYHSTAPSYGIWYIKWDVATGTWGTATMIYNPGGNYLNYYPSICCRPGGDNVHVAWYGRDVVNPTVYRVRHLEYVPSVGWGAMDTVSNTPTDNAYDVGVAVDTANNIHITWVAPVATYNQVFYRPRIGGVWGTIDQVSNTNPSATMYSPAVACDSGGTASVVWDGDNPGNTNDRVFCRTRTGGNWGDTDTVSIYGSGIQYSPAVAVDGASNVHVAWRGYTENSPGRHQVQYRVRRGGVWGEAWELTARTAGTAGIQNPAVAVDGLDRTHIVWYDDNDGDNDVYYLRGEYTDAGVSSISSPSGTMPPGTTVTPSATWRNFGTHNTADFRAFLFLIDPTGTRVYSEYVDIAGLAPGASTTPPLPAFVVNALGTWTVRCSTGVELDPLEGNNILESTFLVVRYPDFEPDHIFQPNGTYDTNAVATPSARWRNNQDDSAGFVAYCMLFNPSGAPVYKESLLVGLAGHMNVTLTFPSHNVGTVEGDWVVRCSTWSADDTVPSNDVLSDQFAVEARPVWPSGWHEVLPSMPAAPSTKAVKDGGWLVESGGLLYAAKGNKTGDFYSYNPDVNVWTTLTPWPGGLEAKLPSKGAAAAASGGYIYATKGNNTVGFWRYNIDSMVWTQMPNVPLYPSGKKVKGGTDMVYIRGGGRDTSYVYLLKGYKTDFFRFNTVTLTWDSTLPAAPTGMKPKWDKGSWLVREGDLIYAHKAKYHEMWVYNIGTRTWGASALIGMPLLGMMGRNKKSKDGGSAVWDNHGIYALKGGNTQEFWYWNADTLVWTERDTMPAYGSTGKKKRVKGGGDLTELDGALYALKGNKTLELWRYVEYPLPQATPGTRGGIASLPAAASPGVVFANPVTDKRLGLEVNSTGTATLRIFDAAGRVVLSQLVTAGSRSIDLGKLSSGVYLVKVDGRDFGATRKLVVK